MVEEVTVTFPVAGLRGIFRYGDRIDQSTGLAARTGVTIRAVLG